MSSALDAAAQSPWLLAAARAATFVACATFGLACGDAAPEAALPSAGRTPNALARTEDSVGGDAPRAAVPPEFAAACLRGDSVESAHWSLDGVTASLLPFTGIETLAARDSARLAARISAAVDVLPSDTSVADFRGLPVSVRAAWVLVPAAGDSVVVALVARRVPIESAPLEELYAIIAAPGQRQGVRDPLISDWVARDVGREEEQPARELVGAIHLGDDLALILAHAAASESRAEIVVRRGGRWRTEWTGPIPSCGADALLR